MYGIIECRDRGRPLAGVQIFAANKHGRIYRVLRPEVTAALIEHMTAVGP